MTCLWTLISSLKIYFERSSRSFIHSFIHVHLCLNMTPGFQERKLRWHKAQTEQGSKMCWTYRYWQETRFLILLQARKKKSSSHSCLPHLQTNEIEFAFSNDTRIFFIPKTYSQIYFRILDKCSDFRRKKYGKRNNTWVFWWPLVLGTLIRQSDGWFRVKRG